jgi:hypothetical protein
MILIIEAKYKDGTLYDFDGILKGFVECKYRGPMFCCNCNSILTRYYIYIIAHLREAGLLKKNFNETELLCCRCLDIRKNTQEIKEHKHL